ncbi:hypothetical protein A2U01_0107567, partial [Trifolium medium]|nr:hypothetical protein [Trifolium medium]
KTSFANERRGAQLLLTPGAIAEAG